MTDINKKLATNLEAFESEYAQHDRETLELLKTRIFEYASHGNPVSYS